MAGIFTPVDIEILYIKKPLTRHEFSSFNQSLCCPASRRCSTSGVCIL